jgi:hypothetical protein
MAPSWIGSRKARNFSEVFDAEVASIQRGGCVVADMLGRTQRVGSNNKAEQSNRV